MNRSTRYAAWGILIFLAAFQAFAHRRALSPDGMSYLDLSDAVVDGRWSTLVNLYWSPLYPFVIGVMRAVAGAGARGEVATIHAVNVLGFAALLASYEYLLMQCIVIADRTTDSVLAKRWGVVLAYVLFGVVTLTMTPLELTTPDHFSNAATLFALGALLRLTDESRGPRAPDGAVLGAALGIGFLAKSFLAPWAMVCFVLLAFVDRRFGFKRVATAVVVWIVFVAPWTFVLSSHAGRFTFGDTGRLTYAWYVNGHDVPSLHGVPPDTRQPAANALLAGVGITGDAPGTDPMWFDPARWNASLAPVVNVHDQLGTIAVTGAVLITSMSVLTYVLFLVAVAPSGTRRGAWRNGWIVWVASFAGIGAYTMVLLTARYVMAFILASILVLFATLPIARRLNPVSIGIGMLLAIAPVALTPLFANPETLPSTRFALSFVAAVTAAMLAGGMANMDRALAWAVKVGVALVLALLAFTTSSRSLILLGAVALTAGIIIAARAAIRRDSVQPFAHGVQAGLGFAVALIFAGRVTLRFMRDANALRTPTESVSAWSMADDLAQHGVPPNTRIALVGPHAESYWARAGRLKIVANVPEPVVGNWWKLPRERRDSLLVLFGNAGAHVAVATMVPPGVEPDSGWTALATGEWIRPLSSSTKR